MAKNQKVVNYKKPFQLNIGIVLFVFIFIYLVFNIFSYVTTTHVSYYEVKQGTMASNNIYNGLILREENVYNATQSGSVNYYIKEASKVSVGNLICSVDENGDVAERINAANENGGNMDAEQLDKLESSISSFENAYDPLAFYTVYSFKDELSSTLNEYLSLDALNSISDYVESASGQNTFHKLTADAPGIVVFYTDGYENVTKDTFTADMFEEASYQKNDRRKVSSVTSGDPLYKLITNEEWQIVFPIDKMLAETLADDTVIEIRFVKDNKKIYANYELLTKNGQDYLVLSLRSSMVRYAKDRYVEVELMLSAKTGLKIPNSSITEKEFFTIPTSYFMQGGDTSTRGLLVERTDDKGNTSAEFVTPTVYFETDDYCYIDSEDISAGETILKSDSKDRYTVGSETATLSGVYNINRGYAVFKQIDILYQNEEYTIVKTGTTYGISLYDHIALDAGKVNENELLK